MKYIPESLLVVGFLISVAVLAINPIRLTDTEEVSALKKIIKIQAETITTLQHIASLHEKDAAQTKDDMNSNTHFYQCAFMDLFSHPIFQIENPPVPSGWQVSGGMVLISNPERYQLH